MILLVAVSHPVPFLLVFRKSVAEFSVTSHSCGICILDLFRVPLALLLRCPAFPVGARLLVEKEGKKMYPTGSRA